MPRYWKEKLDPEKHRDYMPGVQDAGGLPVALPRDNLLVKWVYFARAAGYTFQFHSLEAMEEAKEYFSAKVHPARRAPGIDLEHYWQRWFERLPPGLQGGPREKKFLRLLRKLCWPSKVTNRTRKGA